MKFRDYSPPQSPLLDQQRDALQKGLGRAVQWARNGHLADEPLLEACLRDQRYDLQVGGSRGDWLWGMIRVLGAADRFRVPMLHALYDFSDERSARQICELAGHYAEAGDETFRTRLYEIVEYKPFPDDAWMGEEEIVALDGEQGFLFAAGVRGQLLATREWEWDDGSLMDLAVERFGEEHGSSLLRASSDKAIQRFVESWREDRQQNAAQRPQDSYGERMKAIPVTEIIRAAENEDRCFWFRGWGICAAETDLQAVLRHLWSVRKPTVIANLLSVFSTRPFPQFDARLIDLCRHGDEGVRRRAFSALEQNAHPLIRKFALAELKGSVCNGAVVALFINNYQQGDGGRILEAIEFPDDDCERHWLLMAVVKFLEMNLEADCSRLGIIGYASTPCETCRYYAARLLLKQNVAPEWLREECRYDSGEDCRGLVGKTANSTEAS